MPDSPFPNSPRCPRCGYDLRGETATWTVACPVAGQCAECGLAFAWSELLDPRFGLPRWCVEADDASRGLVGRGVATFARTFLPWHFWTAVRMSHPGRFRRIGLYVLAWLVVLYVAFAVAVGARAADELRRYTAAVGAAMPQVEPGEVFAKAAVLPFSDRSPGTVLVGGIVLPVRPPIPHATYVVREYGVVALLLVGGHGATMLAFGALPVSRRRAKVRWSHVARVGLYGLAPILAVHALGLAGLAVAWTEPAYGELVLTPATLALIAVPVAEVLWWWAATSRYLRMPHAPGVGLAVSTMGFLGAFAVFSAVWVATRPY